MVNHVTNGYVIINGVTFSGGQGASGSTLNWISEGGHESDFNIVDDGDGKLDVGTDYFFTPAISFTEYTITSGGTEYGIFRTAPAIMFRCRLTGLGRQSSRAVAHRMCIKPKPLHTCALLSAA